MKETNIQNEIRIALSHHGIVFRMNTGFFLTETGQRVKCGFPGMSDLLFIGNGFTAWIEVKKPGGRVSSEQKQFIEQMQAKGHRAGVAYCVEDAIRIINGEEI